MASILTILFIVAFCFVAIYLRFNQAKIRGKYGETRVASILSSLPECYYSFNDVYLKQDDMFVQIDHVVISVYGIFVIETKNYTGWIYGTDTSERWTKNMYGTKYYFQNPLRQNYSHVKTLQRMFGLSIDKFVPVVVFLRGATLKCDTQGMVIYSSQLKHFIRSHAAQILSVSDVERLVKALSLLNIVDKKVRKAHIENVHQRLYREKCFIHNGVCPRCGGRLVERQGHYGSFLSCSNYPRCKFTTQRWVP